ncbi:helix-turn-helix domain-containing protein [Listeria monocytogenes]|uniref:DNA-binding protein n=4 Tax=Listeria monocytogenes TaxID=1639 RepID=A0A9P2DMU2_LISMN|nr:MULTISPECIES: helix-turn-helix domain-containing protein [Listeria]EAD3235484.1 DNA-binding protein [Listeria monocytogenes CFSAN002202]EAE1680433.1 DNA-binding protein [Listeria monocytogenes LIS0071]EAE3705926.1 DNA-binding protein [Listeria monocytogenes serotype 1/2b]EAE3730216.1 DNA-binding protein [Listeria monocytogenes serotype 1/2a]EAG6252946.1 DNA-binding protein [Listeria monocytogenes CFSAN003806]EAG6255536.1 DNA-binding protein [Listeria monocytogenes CFSAN003807]EAG6262319.1
MRQQQIDFKWLEENFLTANEAATYLGISKQALLSLAKRDVLPFTKKGNMVLFHRMDIELRLENQQSLREKYRPFET